MKKRAITLIIAAITAISATTAAAQQTEQKDKYVYIDTAIHEFDKITVTSPINVVYKQSSDSTKLLRIYAPEQMKDKIKTEVKDGKLTISCNRGFKNDFNVIIVYAYSKTLTAVECCGGAVFTATEPVSGAYISLKVTGQSQIRCTKLNYDEVKGRRGIGQGDLIIGGKTTKANLSILGRGEINAENLISKEVSCRMFGKGDIGCHVNETIEVRSIGRGCAYCKGDLPISGKHDKIREMVK